MTLDLQAAIDICLAISTAFAVAVAVYVGESGQ